MKKVRNRTSAVPDGKSIAMIQDRLRSIGADEVTIKYATWGDDRYVGALSFSVDVGGKMVSYRLPAKVERIYEVFIEGFEFTDTQLEKKFAQAKRTAWKLIFEWIDIQVTMIQLGQVEAAEVFMPYMIVSWDGTTLFDAAMAGGRYGEKMLEAPKGAHVDTKR